MNVTDCDNMTDDYNDSFSLNNNRTNNDNDIEIKITLLTIIPCGLSLLCLLSSMVYTLTKP